MTPYATELRKAMAMLAEDPRTVFIGQAVGSPGTSMYGTLADIPAVRRIEFPVAEDMQLGVSIGMALDGAIPVSIFPRWNFLLLAANQLVNHLDKLPLMSDYSPQVIVRTGIGSEYPMHPGHQHIGDFTEAMAAMCLTTRFTFLKTSEAVVPAYREALAWKGATVLVEVSDYYNEDVERLY